jgi:glyoxylase-like metal-dependent hydrolase (beta-lactamase superfamily II)
LSAALPGFVEPLGHGIYAIDTGFHRPRFDAAYLLVHAGRAAFIDTGTNYAVPRLLQALQALDLTPAAVDWVIPTHVHLDHAGGAGLLMRALPGATLLVHPRGARHLIDPRALVEGARAVYGAAAVARAYGAIEPVEAARVQSSTDGMTITLAGRPLELIDTPGHARHHHCIWDEATRGWFSGDTFGLSYPEFDTARGSLAVPTTTPVQFEPGPLAASIERMLAREPARIYLTHYGCVTAPVPHGRALLEGLAAMEAIALRLRDHPQRHEALKAAFADLYAARAAAHGAALDDATVRALLALDVELNAQGVGVWLDRAVRA